MKAAPFASAASAGSRKRRSFHRIVGHGPFGRCVRGRQIRFCLGTGFRKRGRLTCPSRHHIHQIFTRMRKVVYLGLDGHTRTCVLAATDSSGNQISAKDFPTSEAALIHHLIEIRGISVINPVSTTDQGVALRISIDLFRYIWTQRRSNPPTASSPL